MKMIQSTDEVNSALSLGNFKMTAEDRRALRPKEDLIRRIACRILAEYHVSTDDLDDIEIALIRGYVIAFLSAQPHFKLGG